MKRDPNGGRLVGADLGDFIVGEFLSSGGQASVHRGRHKPPIDAPVAIKFLHPLYAADPDIVDSFRDEARTTGMMSHPNIVKVLAFGQLEELPWLAMEFVDGADLASLLERRAGPMPSDPMPMKTAIVILRDAGLALEHAHSHNVIHRDVKPSNVLISRSGDVKLSDFGIARATHASRRTAPGTLKGSLAYMSPEQTRRESLDIPGGKRSDIFSMGIVAYELLAGVHPFLRNDPEKIIEAIRTYEPRSLSTYDRPLPNAVVLLVEEMLKKNPRERWDEIGKAVEVLEGAIQDLGVRGARDLVASFQRDPLVTSGNPGSGSPDPVPEENGKSTPWRRWLLVGASLAVVASGAWWVWHRGENTGGAPADTVETIVPQPTDRPSPHVPPETTVVQNVQDHPSGEATTFERTYRINTKPGAATVYVDGEPTSHDLAFDVKLREGQHQFRVVHEQLGIDLTLKYLVRSGDSAKTLLLDYANERIDTKP